MVVAGMYGVMSYVVTHRRREFGVRIALATPGDLLALVLSQGLQVTAIGIPVGGLGGRRPLAVCRRTTV